MGADTAVAAARPSTARNRLLTDFARQLGRRYNARVFLFGSRARGTAHADSDYDLIAVSDSFAAEPRRWRRCPDRYRIWWALGGWGVGLDLWCFTEKEFATQLRGVGFLGSAKHRGKVVEVTPGDTV